MDTVRVWFRPAETPYFYWLILEGEGRAAVALIGDVPHEVRGLLQRFLAEKDLAPVEYQAARVPLYTRWRLISKRLHGRDVYLVGDAAGHVKPTTIGGLVNGFMGAAGVVDKVLGRRSSNRRSLRRELDRHSMIRRVLDSFGDDEYRKFLLLMGAPQHRLLGAYNRDDSYRLLWRMCVREPRLAALALTSLRAARSSNANADAYDDATNGTPSRSRSVARIVRSRAVQVDRSRNSRMAASDATNDAGARMISPSLPTNSSRPV